MTAIAAISGLLAACQTAAGGDSRAACGQWRGISWSAKDTPETVDGVKGNNARRRAWCG